MINKSKIDRILNNQGFYWGFLIESTTLFFFMVFTENQLVIICSLVQVFIASIAFIVLGSIRANFGHWRGKKAAQFSSIHETLDGLRDVLLFDEEDKKQEYWKILETLSKD